MVGAVATSEELKKIEPQIKTLFVGGHMAALPRETLLNEDSIDLIALNEGVYAISNLLKVENLNDDNLLKRVAIKLRNFSSVLISLVRGLLKGTLKTSSITPFFSKKILSAKKIASSISCVTNRVVFFCLFHSHAAQIPFSLNCCLGRV